MALQQTERLYILHRRNPLLRPSESEVIKMFPIIVLLVASQLTAGAAQPQAPPQYLVRITVREKYTGPTKKPGVIHADPSLMVLAGSEANFHVGEAMTIGGEKIPTGTIVKLRIDPMQGDQVRIVGTVEVSSLSAPVEDVVVRQSMSIHLAKTVTCGKNSRIRMSKTDESEITCFLQIDRVGEQTAQLKGVQLKDVPR
jgi:hypothetical protein